jgi:hypothetical protein
MGARTADKPRPSDAAAERERGERAELEGAVNFEEICADKPSKAENSASQGFPMESGVERTKSKS